MTYYKANEWQENLYTVKQNYIDIVKNELYTIKEFERLCKNTKYIKKNLFDTVIISNKKTHFFFGARFEDKEVI